ncbi:MAG: hypothetical protein LBI73_01360 [Myroides sp.]|nr:hypothetical protein [Myroides marinus]MDR0193743.1 hypothetical protein [Myroides sp.]
MKPIRTEEDYHMALVRLQLLKDAKPNTPEADEYEVINILLEHYERENAPMGMPDPIDSIKIFTEYFNDEEQDSNEEE